MALSVPRFKNASPPASIGAQSLTERQGTLKRPALSFVATDASLMNAMTLWRLSSTGGPEPPAMITETHTVRNTARVSFLLLILLGHCADAQVL